MTIYRTKVGLLSGTSLSEITKQARQVIHAIERRTKRQPYIRSAYFHKQKVFLNYFWPHIHQKVPPERARRLKYLSAAIELIRHSKQHPQTQQDPGNPKYVLHRFTGITNDNKQFIVQIKENKRSKKLLFMSCFPVRNQ